MRRRTSVAGSWYPASPAVLGPEVDGLLARAGTAPVPAPRAVIVPHAGLRYSGPVAARAYAVLRTAAYRAVVLVGPSHYDSFEGVSIWSRGAWDTPFGPVLVDEPLARALIGATHLVYERPSAHGREHSLEMQMPFLARLLPDVPIVPLVMGHQTRPTAEALGSALADVIAAVESGGGDGRQGSSGGTRVLLVASTDLSHYEDAPTASTLDAVVIRHVEALDPAGLMAALERDPRHACGGGPLVAVLSAALALGAAGAHVLHYGDSGDVTGDKSSVVGYLAAAVW